jgi:hypothetical protein
MNNNIRLIINEESINISKSRSVTGEIYFKVNNKYFPEIKWNDFIETVMKWWIQTIIEIVNADIDQVFELLYMDGPYLIRGIKIDNDTMLLNFLKRKINVEENIISTKCSILEFKILLINAAKVVIETVEKRKWDTKETAELRRIVHVIS